MTYRLAIRAVAYIVAGLFAGLVVIWLLDPSSQVLGTLAIVAALLSIRYELAAIRIALKAIAERLGARL